MSLSVKFVTRNSIWNGDWWNTWLFIQTKQSLASILQETCLVLLISSGENSSMHPKIQNPASQLKQVLSKKNILMKSRRMMMLIQQVKKQLLVIWTVKFRRKAKMIILKMFRSNVLFVNVHFYTKKKWLTTWRQIISSGYSFLMFWQTPDQAAVCNKPIVAGLVTVNHLCYKLF